MMPFDEAGYPERARSRTLPLRSGQHRGPGPTDRQIPPTGDPGRDRRPHLPAQPGARHRQAAGGQGAAQRCPHTCNFSACAEQAQIIKTNLAAIGVDLQVRPFTYDQLFERINTKGEPFDLATVGWIADYPDPANFLNAPLLGGQGPALDNPVYRARLAAAARLSGTRRYLAYSRLDTDLSRNVAPWVAYGSHTNQDFFSARTGCQVFNPLYGIDLAALCLIH
jgi:ABC-type transport system substrate-binding protein